MRTPNARKSRTLWFLGVTLAAAGALGGCVSSSSNDTRFYLSWTLVTADGQPATCTDVGGVTVELNLLAVKGEQRYKDRFDCKAKEGLSEKLPQGDYQVSISLLDGAGTVMAQTAVQVVTLSGGRVDLGIVQFQPGAEDQYFQLSWTLEDNATHQVLSCADVGGTKVELQTQLSGQAPVAYDFDCTAMAGRTTTVTPGTYGISVALYDGANKLLSSANMTDIVVSAGVPTVLPALVFDVNR